MLQRCLLAAALLACSSVASAQHFGKNKVQYKDFDWRVLETPHFEIHFYEREAEVVRDAARMAERSYERLSTTLRHSFDKRIPLILYASHSDFQQTNITPGRIDLGTGGITELARRRVFLPFTGSYAELEHVLTHELVHAFELDILLESPDPRGVFASLPPLWVMEGLAEFLSKDVRDTHTDMWLRDAALSGKLVPPSQMHLVGDIRVYRYGQDIFRYFAKRFGVERIGDLLRAIADHHDLADAFLETTGVTFESFSSDWVIETQRAHLPEISEHRVTREFARPLVRRADERASMVLAPSISPDGDRLAYVSDRGLTNDLYCRNLDQPGDPQRLVRGGISGDFESLRFFHATPAWSPDGRFLAFPAQTGGQDALYVLDADSGAIVERLRFGLDEVQTPSFSPDGEEIAFAGLAGGRSNLYRVRRDGSGLRQLTHDRHTVRDPQWSPDGGSIVFVTDAGPDTDFERLEFGRFHMVLLDLDTGERRDITPFDHGKAVGPVWSGDGESIAFVSDQDGISNIYILHLPTGGVFRLTDTVTGVSGILPSSPPLSWARESGRLAFSAFDSAGWDVYVIDDPTARMTPVEMQPGTVEPVVDPEAIATLLLSDPQPDVALAATTTADPGQATDESEFVERDYDVRFKPDLSNVGGVVGFNSGVGGQSLLHFSDLLGNHTLTLGVGIYGSFQDSDLALGYTNRSQRINWNVAAFQYRRRFGFVSGPRSDVGRQTYRGVRFAAERPFSTFSRLEGSLQFAGVGGRFAFGHGIDDTGDEVRAFVSPGLAWVLDTALFGPTGPMFGRRMRVSLEAGIGQVEYATLEADVRRYWNIKRRYAVAARGYLGVSVGSTPQTFYLGGPHSLRGYAYGSLIGARAALASVEFRFPMLDYLALGWPLPLRLYNVRGALFADAASAWDDTFLRSSRALAGDPVGRGVLASWGFGARINLGTFVLKTDWAWRYDPDVRNVSTGTNVSLGADF